MATKDCFVAPPSAALLAKTGMRDAPTGCEKILYNSLYGLYNKSCNLLTKNELGMRRALLPSSPPPYAGLIER